MNTTESTSKTTLGNSVDGNITILAASAGGGGVILITIIITLSILVYKRRQNKLVVIVYLCLYICYFYLAFDPYRVATNSFFICG